MRKILVIGASGFVGGHVARALLASGHEVRCLARQPAKVQDLATAGCEVVAGDISDLASLEQALESVGAVYILFHTLAPQHASTAGQGFMDIEMKGLQNIVAACRPHGVRRLIYVTSLGITPDGPGEWVRGRWETEQYLLKSGPARSWGSAGSGSG